MRKISIAWMASSLLLLSACATSDTGPVDPTPTSIPPTESVPVPTYPDVAYIDDGEPKHTLDIYLPDAAEAPFPTIFFIHGIGETKEAHTGFASHFAERGYATVLTEHRYPNEPDEPLMFQDAFCSLAWVHANADTYGFDRDQVFVFGFSLGALIAADLGTVDDTSRFMEGCPHQLPASGWTKGVATYGGVFVTPEVCLVESWCWSGAASGNKIPVTQFLPIVEALLELPPSGWRESTELSAEAINFAQTLPLYWVDGNDPPFLLIHASNDGTVPPGESEAFAARLEAAGVEVELILLPSAGHRSIYGSGPSFIKIAEAVEAFIVEQ